MKIPNVYAKRWFQLDRSYWFLLLLLGSIALFGWGFKKKFFVVCPLVEIERIGQFSDASLINQTFKLDEEIVFKPINVTDTNLNWYFDGKHVLTNNLLKHSFSTPGKHTVQLVVNEKCNYYAIVQIVPYRHATTNSLTDVTKIDPSLIIEGPDRFEIGAITYFSTSIGAKHYEWSIVEMPEYGIKNEATVGYSIINPGVYTLQLILDENPNKKFTKTIHVVSIQNTISDGILDVPKPVDISDNSQGNSGSKEVVPVVQEQKVMVPDNELLAMLKLIRDDKKNMNDILPGMCKGAQTKVLANDEKVMTLAELCELLQSKKWALGRKPKVNSLSTVRDAENGNCVSVIYVKYK